MRTIKIVVCGDFRAAYPEKIKIEKDVAEIINSADICICNFEAPIKTLNAEPMKKSGPALDQSDKAPEFLIKAGFNTILLANNHIMDYGRDGLYATIESFKDIVVVGVGNASDAFCVKYIDVKGKKIGLLSLVQREFGVLENINDCGCGAAWINSPDIPNIVKEAKENCDYLLVLPHAGVEHTAAPLPEWRNIYKHFIDWGADCVIASHPHCPQGWEKYKEKLIYYSLGDFYFDELTYDDMWYRSIVVEISIDSKLNTKEYFVCFDDKNGSICIDNSVRMIEWVERANKLLFNDKEYIEYIDKMCVSHYSGIRYGILRGVCGVSFKLRLKYIIRLLGCMLLNNTDEMYLLNAFQCESHRWVIERCLRNKNKQ